MPWLTRRSSSLLLCLSLLIVGISGCQHLPHVQRAGQTAAPLYLPPTPISPAATAPAPQPTASAALPTAILQVEPSPTPQCEDNLRYLADLTVPDGSVVPAGTQVDKRWQVENNGTCNWDKRYRLRFIAGVDLGLPSEQALYPARSGAQFTLRIVFTAPTEAGPYRSAWQAFSPAGEPFGDPVFVDIIVQEGGD